MADMNKPTGTTQTGTPREQAQTRSTSSQTTYRTDQGEHKAEKMGEKVKATASQTTQRAKEALHEASDAITGSASQAAASAQSTARDFAHRQKERIAQEIDTCCSALKDAADKYDEESATNLGSYASAAADGLSRAKSYLENSDMEHMLEDAERAVRNHRELAYGACFVAGLGLARFLKASARSQANGSKDYATRSQHQSRPASPSPSRPMRTPQPTSYGAQPTSSSTLHTTGATTTPPEIS